MNPVHTLFQREWKLGENKRETLLSLPGFLLDCRLELKQRGLVSCIADAERDSCDESE